MRNMITYPPHNGGLMDQFSESYKTGAIKPTPEEIHFYGNEFTKIILNRMVTETDLRIIDHMFVEKFGFDRFLNLFSLAMFREDSSEFHPEDAAIIKPYHELWDSNRPPVDLNTVTILCKRMTEEFESEVILTSLGFVPDWYSYGLIYELRNGDTFKELTKNFTFATADTPLPMYGNCDVCPYFNPEGEDGPGLFDLNPDNNQQ
jgi:hypothetical protein